MTCSFFMRSVVGILLSAIATFAAADDAKDEAIKNDDAGLRLGGKDRALVFAGQANARFRRGTQAACLLGEETRQPADERVSVGFPPANQHKRLTMLVAELAGKERQ